MKYYKNVWEYLPKLHSGDKVCFKDVKQFLPNEQYEVYSIQGTRGNNQSTLLFSSKAGDFEFSSKYFYQSVAVLDNEDFTQLWKNKQIVLTADPTVGIKQIRI